MKKKILLAVLICFVSIINIQSVAFAETPSEWSKQAIEEARKFGFIPNTEQFNELYTSTMTKYDFLKLIAYSIENEYNDSISKFVKSRGINIQYYNEGSIKFVGNIEGKVNVYADWTQEKKEEVEYIIDTKYTLSANVPYKDINDYDIYYLNALGLIDCNKKGLFNGDVYITRKEIAEVLYRFASIYNQNLTFTEQNYSDKNLITASSKNAVDFVTSNKIMMLKQGNRFAPKENCTFEESYAMILNFAKLYMPSIFKNYNIEVVLEPTYDSVHKFSDGLASVERDNKYFYINESLQEVIELNYEGCFTAGDFSNGRAVVSCEGYYVIIDKQGNEMFRFNKNELYLSTIINEDGYVQASTKTGLTRFIYVNVKDGKIYDYSSMEPIGDGLLKVKQKPEYRTFCGVIDKLGKVIVPCKYEKVEISDYFIYGEREEGDTKVTKFYAAYDKEGNEIVKDDSYYSFGVLDNGCIVYTKDEKTIYINIKGELLFDPDEYSVVNNQGDYFKIENNRNKTTKIINNCGDVIDLDLQNIKILGEGYFYDESSDIIVDANGKQILKNVSKTSNFSEGIISVKKGGYWKLYNTSFEEIATVKESIMYFDDFSDGFAYILSSDFKRSGVVDTKGNVISPFSDEFYVANREKDLVVVMTDENKFGCINRNGDMILDVKYDEIKADGHLIVVKLNGLYGVYDYEGKQLADIKYVKGMLYYDEPFAEIKDEEGKYFILDKKGNRYTEISKVLETDMFCVIVPSNEEYMTRAYGLMNSQGDLLSDVKYRSIYYSEPYIEVNRIDYYNYYDLQGNKVISSKFCLGDGIGGGLFIANNGHSSGIINTKNEIVIPFDYEALYKVSNDLLAFKKNGKCGYIKNIK